MTEDAKLTDFLEDGREESDVKDAETQAVESTQSSSESANSSNESAVSPDESTEKSGEPVGPPDETTTESDEAAGTAPGTVEPAVTTYGWGTYRCSRCAAVTARVWRSDEEFVCPDCKRW